MDSTAPADADIANFEDQARKFIVFSVALHTRVGYIRTAKLAALGDEQDLHLWLGVPVVNNCQMRG